MNKKANCTCRRLQTYVKRRVLWLDMVINVGGAEGEEWGAATAEKQLRQEEQHNRSCVAGHALDAVLSQVVAKGWR